MPARNTPVPLNFQGETGVLERKGLAMKAKLLMVLCLCLGLVTSFSPVMAGEPTPEGENPEFAEVNLLTVVKQVRWFEVSWYCKVGDGCVLEPIVGFRPMSVDDLTRGKIPCFYEKKQELLPKGSCFFKLIDPLKGDAFFVVVARKGLDRNIFVVAPQPLPTPSPEDDKLGG